LPPWRHLAARAAPTCVWRFARSGRGLCSDGWREGRDGLH
jgi:hypothetical protein